MSKQTSGRQYVHILLDPLVYLKLKASGENMSQLGNRLFESYFELQDREVPEEIEILDEMKKAEKHIEEQKSKLNELSILLAKARQERSVQEKLDAEAKEDAHDLAIQMSREQELKKYRGFNA
jgi:hypothetical protein